MRAFPFPLTALVAAASALGACDFTPTLDIETPEYEAGVAVRGFLVADSVAMVSVSESWDPYEGRPRRTYGPDDEVQATVTLLRDGVGVERLTERRDRCVDQTQPPVPQGGEIQTYPCGPYLGKAPIEAGATYTLRVEAEGLPPAEATVTVPRRPGVEVVEEDTEAGEPRRLRVRLDDPEGSGDLYGLTLLRTITDTYITTCDPSGCVEETRTYRYPTSFDTSDPVLLSAAAEVDGDITFVSFTDATFDGRGKEFSISPEAAYGDEETDRPLTIQVAALSRDIYDTYRITYFGGGDDNPFAEPVNLPSNVEGGYGLVGGIALAEVTLPPRE